MGQPTKGKGIQGTNENQSLEKNAKFENTTKNTVRCLRLVVFCNLQLSPQSYLSEDQSLAERSGEYDHKVN
jgi:hypothetical protein